MKIKEYTDAISQSFCNKQVLVIGDLMVDRYINGKVRKISPEAPVPVLDYKEKRYVAGGASNVVNNLIGLGAKASVAGVVSDDDAGRWLVNNLSSGGASVDGIFFDNSRPTTMKTRYTTKGYQLLRVDREITEEISKEAQDSIYKYCEEVIGKTDAVILSDYLKGVLKDKDFISRIVALCEANNVFVAVDTKTLNIEFYKNVDMLTPNIDEMANAVGMNVETEEDINKAGNRYLEDSMAKMLVLTRGDKGISVFSKGESRRDFPAKDVEVFDVSGAGDTVLSTITMGIISGLNIDDSVKVANYAAGVVITKRGTAAITSKELIKTLNEEQDS